MRTVILLLAAALTTAAAVAARPLDHRESAGLSPTGVPQPEAIVVTGARVRDHDREQGTFALCHGAGRITCVVDGDTFWYEGTKIRITDINAPEVGHPACEFEARLAAEATERLMQLLNAGPFSLATEGRETDRYGRALRVVMRRGASLGVVLEREGLAEHWHGRRGDWCAA
jgi:endonuclease YncB( thermonuclease family)